MTKAVKEFLLDQGTGEVNVEYSDNTTTSFNLANAVTATQSGGGLRNTYPGVVGRRLGVIGHSISADAVGITAIDKSWRQWGYLTWARRKLCGRVEISHSTMFAVAGKNVAEVAVEQVPLAVAAGIDYCIVDVGINSVTQGANYASMIGDYSTILSGLVRAGVFAFVIGIRVRSGAQALTAEQARLVSRVNLWLAQYAIRQPGVRFIDPNPAYLDFATGNSQTAYLRDGTHDTTAGGRLLGGIVADAVSDVVPPMPFGFNLAADVYNADNPTGNLLVNGLFAGTTGTVGGNASGQVATGWTGNRTISGTTTATFSVAADADYPTLQNQVITLGGTGDAGLTTLQQSQVVPGNAVAGDVVVMELEVQWSSLSAGFKEISLNVNSRTAAFVTMSQGWDGVAPGANGDFGAWTDGWMLFRSEPITVMGGAERLETILRIQAAASGPVSGVVKVRRGALRKVLAS